MSTQACSIWAISSLLTALFVTIAPALKFPEAVVDRVFEAHGEALGHLANGEEPTAAAVRVHAGASAGRITGGPSASLQGVARLGFGSEAPGGVGAWRQIS